MEGQAPVSSKGDWNEQRDEKEAGGMRNKRGMSWCCSLCRKDGRDANSASFCSQQARIAVAFLVFPNQPHPFFYLLLFFLLVNNLFFSFFFLFTSTSNSPHITNNKTTTKYQQASIDRTTLAAGEHASLELQPASQHQQQPTTIHCTQKTPVFKQLPAQNRTQHSTT